MIIKWYWNNYQGTKRIRRDRKATTKSIYFLPKTAYPVEVKQSDHSVHDTPHSGMVTCFFPSVSIQSHKCETERAAQPFFKVKALHSPHRSNLILLEDTTSRSKADSQRQKEVITYFSVPTHFPKGPSIHTHLTPCSTELSSSQNETQLTQPCPWILYNDKSLIANELLN